jgi:hypothetical protein
MLSMSSSPSSSGSEPLPKSTPPSLGREVKGVREGGGDKLVLGPKVVRLVDLGILWQFAVRLRPSLAHRKLRGGRCRPSSSSPRPRCTFE